MTNRFMIHDAEYIGMEFTEKQLYEAIHRLCHFVPVDSADNLCSAVHDFLIQHAMATHGVIPLKLSEVRDSLKNIFGMDFELKEVEGTLKRLHKAKKVVYSQEKYRLDLRKCNGLRKSVKDCEDRERKIIDDWLKSVATKYPELSNNDLQRLEKDLKIFAAKIFVQHGAKCADLIYANQEKRAVIVDNPEEFLSKILPKYPVLDKIRSTELPAFFKDAKGEREMYIAELLNSSFMLHAIQIDNTCSAIIQKISRGRLLYLDTNVLYALVGLSTPRDTKAVRRLIEISQQIGYVVTISTKTMGEFKSSLDYATKNLKKFPRVPKNIAKIAAIYSSGSFITAYWRKHAETNISPEDFVATYRNTKSLLAQYNIGVRDDLCAEVQDDPELKNQIDMLYAAEDPTPIPMNIAEHQLSKL